MDEHKISRTKMLKKYFMLKRRIAKYFYIRNISFFCIQESFKAKNTNLDKWAYPQTCS